MGLIECKCPNCGSVLKINNNLESAVCEYCGSTFVVEKAIYNITNITNNNINAQTVNIYQGNSDFDIEARILKRYKGENTIVHIPENVKISECKFPDGVTEIYYPDTCITVNNKFPTSLEKIKLPSDLTWLPESCFEGCDRLKEVIMPKSIRAIPKSCFKGCTALKKIELYEGLETIEPYAFQKSGLEEINLPKTLKGIGLAALSGTNIEEIEIPGIKEVGYFMSDCPRLNRVKLNEGTKKIRNTFQWCGKLMYINIPRSVEVIDCPFMRCNSLWKIFIPASVKCITDHSFEDCTILTVYCEQQKPKIGHPKGWERNWAKNIFNKPTLKGIVWGCSEEEYNKL